MSYDTSYCTMSTNLKNLLPPPPPPVKGCDLKSVMNSCSVNAPYTRIIDLREECGYRVVKLERVNTPYGETVMCVLEGLVGDEFYLRVYLPRRFNEILTDRMMDDYNDGLGDRLHLVRRSARPGSKFTPLEFL